MIQKELCFAKLVYSLLSCACPCSTLIQSGDRQAFAEFTRSVHVPSHKQQTTSKRKNNFYSSVDVVFAALVTLS